VTGHHHQEPETRIENGKDVKFSVDVGAALSFLFPLFAFLFPGIWLMDSPHSLEWRVLQSATTVLGTS